MQGREAHQRLCENKARDPCPMANHSKGAALRGDEGVAYPSQLVVYVDHVFSTVVCGTTSGCRDPHGGGSGNQHGLGRRLMSTHRTAIFTLYESKHELPEMVPANFKIRHPREKFEGAFRKAAVASWTA